MMNKLLLLICLWMAIPDAPCTAQKQPVTLDLRDLRHLQIVKPAEASPAEEKAAGELRRYLQMIIGVDIPVVSENSKMKTGEFILGLTNRTPDPLELKTLDPDGFMIRTAGKKIYLAGGTGKGVLYGVYELLERCFGCRFWAPGAEYVPRAETLTVPVIDIRMQPAFAFREVAYAGMDDPDFMDKMRCDRHAWEHGGEWGMWVHTMFSLVPPEKYFDTHPEYYALMAGQRARTQLCLTNPDVLQITIRSLAERMKEQPGCRYWSVSQMDTYGWCECDNCKAIDEHEGSPSGTMISFVNKVAAAFPDKVISTLAYQYTRKPPRNLKPAPNVNIMLCTIECDRSKPLAEEQSKEAFVHDLIGWSAITGNILVWDYVIQFTNMIAPFPNLHVLQPNIRFFRDHRVNAVFEQGCRGTYSEIQELRQYLLAKLLWNPDANVDSLITLFTDGYYGKAGPFIRQYLSALERALKESGKTLWIYGSPMQETDAFLGPGQIADYNRFFGQAVEAVRSDSILLTRVEKARLPLQYAMIEVSKKYITGPGGFMDSVDGGYRIRQENIRQVEEFVGLANRYGVKTVHERTLTPDDYGAKTLDLFRRAYTPHLALGARYTLNREPSAQYQAEGPLTLTDGKRGSENYYVLWQGFEGQDFTAVVDLGYTKAFNWLGAEFLQVTASWIFSPVSMTISVSDDGVSFRDVAVFDSLRCEDPVAIRTIGREIHQQEARYVRFFAEGEKICPPWHIGHGGKAWLFVDELMVENRH